MKLSGARRRADELRKEAIEKYGAARRALHSLLLFAPTRVARSLNRIFGLMTTDYLRVRLPLDEAEPPQLPSPEFPDEEWKKLRNAVRRDLGVRRLRLNSRGLA
jgi:hypothetical protein